ncbi:MAG TPA: DUF1015 domain-containing protein [Candidatus Avoscillospira stercoripullorum]|uniref:DUF1015 domain-containing protein n=1 Tax=Candidatus Avoscillospira stercoripullorum TaxID=2840709 RepID=A0A9D1D856_9FIRM|nr:DUF1015 domain-containing protein [Candidatus Avoscillospira stercoripullorum]
MQAFLPADILMPRVDSMEKWAVIACDQFSSQPAYWERVRETAGDAPSTINLILPEAELGTPQEAAHTALINETMAKYRKGGVFQTYARSFVYVERTLESGAIRKGLVGMVDLDAYDYSTGSTSAIRATEKTVVERIPPRMRVRKDAPIELPHILMLCDDHDKVLLEPIAAGKETLPKLYDFDLMEGGGHITGWLVQGKAVDDFEARLADYTAHVGEKYKGLPGVPMVFAVGDGNHSLATAKACYEELKKAHPGEDLSSHPARFALVELENIHDEAQVFEPIHRVITHTDPSAMLKALEDWCAPGGFPVEWYIGQDHGTIYLDKARSQLAVGVLQAFLDQYLSSHPGEIDYIHGDADLKELAAQDGAIGFLLPAMEKSQLFRGVIADGILPRKTFSMGHAREKRYYLEGRAIK